MCSFCTRLIDSSPPATTIGTRSTITRWAARAIACRPDEQNRLTVTPAVVPRSRASRPAVRAVRGVDSGGCGTRNPAWGGAGEGALEAPSDYLAAGVVLDDEPGDAVTRGAFGQVVARKPARVLQLLGVDRDLAARVAGNEADHELAGKRPVLAADVLDVLHVHADLFLHLPTHRALQRLAVVHEARHQRVAPRGPAGLASEQHAVARPAGPRGATRWW